MKKQSNNVLTKDSIYRTSKRVKSIKQKERRKQVRLNNTEREEKILSHYKAILSEHKRTEKPIIKRARPEKFLKLFEFLPSGKFDKRNTLTTGKEWKCHSFNEKKQVMDFFHTFIYPYPLPESLVFTSIQEDLFDDGCYKLCYSKDFAIIQKSRKWLSDIICEKSFFKKNKDYFTKAEAHYFLSSNIPYKNNNTVISMYFDAKCKARGLRQSLSTIITSVFTVKFYDTYNCPIVTGFLDLLARYPDYSITADELGDICDFVKVKILKYHKSFGKSSFFSFSGRTISSVILLANEWHRQHQRELRLLHRFNRGQNIIDIPEKWDGFGVCNYRYKNGDNTWIIKQLCTVNDLANEGRKMKHCVASYAYRCSNHECAIFSISCLNETVNTTESVATVEVSSHYEIVQIKGKCNSSVNSKVLNVVSRWAQQEKLKINTFISNRIGV